jgi:hypothetical protein
MQIIYVLLDLLNDRELNQYTADYFLGLIAKLALVSGNSVVGIQEVKDLFGVR